MITYSERRSKDCGREVLIVEDHEVARQQLAYALESQSFSVREAANSKDAMNEMERGDVGVVLVDHILSDEIDGIELARRIQRRFPMSSVIFMSGNPPTTVDQKRARDSGIRVGGWLEKSLNLTELIQLIRIEQSKLKELLEAKAAAPEPTMQELARAIDAVYDEMRDLITANTGKPGFREALAALREKLRVLQEQEAEEIAKRYDAFFRPNLDEAKQLIEQARQLLRKS